MASRKEIISLAVVPARVALQRQDGVPLHEKKPFPSGSIAFLDFLWVFCMQHNATTTHTQEHSPEECLASISQAPACKSKQQKLSVLFHCLRFP